MELLKGNKLTFKNGFGEIWIGDAVKFIHYRSYGQSAIKIDFEEFEWLIDELLKIDCKDIKVEITS